MKLLKVVGILLVAALLIIPASTARAFSQTPEQMAVCASVIGGISQNQVSLGKSRTCFFCKNYLFSLQQIDYQFLDLVK